jgi:hypothetical protein
MTTFGINDPAALSLAEVAKASVRLELAPPSEGDHELQTTLAGGWWPHTRELALELPLLVTAFAERGVQIARVTYHPSLWLIAPPKLRLHGHTLRLAWAREIDPNVVILRTEQNAQIDLLVVPPDADAEVASRALAAAVEPGNTMPATAVLQSAEGPVASA